VIRSPEVSESGEVHEKKLQWMWKDQQDSVTVIGGQK
jgi:hypothetical protein